MAKKSAEEELAILETLTDFTSKENWDKFFSLRGAGDSFEWYSEWNQLRGPLLAHLSGCGGGGGGATGPRILVPGCGSSRLSEHVYDAGFRNITNIDFSRVVVSDMLRRHLRTRPEMRWRVMDMTDMQFEDDYFDVVLDKGGLDALMEPAVGSVLGKKYLKEVKRVLKFGGKFICLTLAETHVIRLLFSEFRFGWATSIEALSQKPSEAYQTFMVTVVEENFHYLKPVTSLLNSSALDFKAKQGHMLVAELDNENQLRSEYSSREDILYSVRDLELGAVGDLKKLHPGFRCQLILGEQGESIYTYKAVILDAQQDSDSFAYQCGVFIVPK